MGTILARYAELGLKSERVRSRFLHQLVENISERLTARGIEHMIETERGRIFIDTDRVGETKDLLSTIPGIFSFSVVERAPSEFDALMDAMADHARTRLKEGMSFGIKVNRTGSTPYSSRDVAVHGGDAVCRHLDDGKVSVDLKHPDIWFEVEIRGKKAYLFTERTRGIGGMPSDTQGKVLLFLPKRDALAEGRPLSGLRAVLSRKMMIRRGCRVIPAVSDSDLEDWNDILKELNEGGKDPFMIHGTDLEEGIIDALRKTGARGLIHPGSEEDLNMVPFVHRRGFPAAVFLPTVAMDPNEMEEWNSRLG